MKTFQLNWVTWKQVKNCEKPNRIKTDGEAVSLQYFS